MHKVFNSRQLFFEKKTEFHLYLNNLHLAPYEFLKSKTNLFLLILNVVLFPRMQEHYSYEKRKSKLI
jgi:hypothetical protein